MRQLKTNRRVVNGCKNSGRWLENGDLLNWSSLFPREMRDPLIEKKRASGEQAFVQKMP